jgi:hypothetical protein
MANVKYKNAPVSEVILGVTFKDGLLARNNYFIEIIHEFLNEYPYSPYNCFSKMVQGTDGNYRIQGLENILPMVYSIKAIKG